MFQWIEDEIGISKKISVTLFVLILLLVVALSVRGLFFNYVDSYELGYLYDSRTGTTTVLSRTGYIFSLPLVNTVHTIDTRPLQVCITASTSSTSGSVNTRVLNCKLVQFNPDGIQTLLAWHGRADYPQSSLSEILKIYAYDGSNKPYPFLIIVKELKNEDRVQ